MPPKYSPKKTSPPISKFKNAGAEAGSPFTSGKKDDRHVLLYKGVKNGAMVAWLKQAKENAEPFNQPTHKFLKENPDKLEELHIAAILNRRGDDGEKLLQSTTSTFPWRQFILIIGEKNNTPAKRKQYAEALVTFFNSLATSAYYTYVRKVKLGMDLTDTPLGPVDSVLLDDDVVGLMLSAYEGTPLEEVAVHDSIMKTFWTDIAHGREVVEAVVALEAGFQGAPDGGAAAGDDGADGGEKVEMVEKRMKRAVEKAMKKAAILLTAMRRMNRRLV